MSALGQIGIPLSGQTAVRLGTMPIMDIINLRSQGGFKDLTPITFFQQWKTTDEALFWITIANEEDLTKALNSEDKFISTTALGVKFDLNSGA